MFWLIVFLISCFNHRSKEVVVEESECSITITIQKGDEMLAFVYQLWLIIDGHDSWDMVGFFTSEKDATAEVQKWKKGRDSLQYRIVQVLSIRSCNEDS